MESLICCRTRPQVISAVGQSFSTEGYLELLLGFRVRQTSSSAQKETHLGVPETSQTSPDFCALVPPSCPSPRTAESTAFLPLSTSESSHPWFPQCCMLLSPNFPPVFAPTALGLVLDASSLCPLVAPSHLAISPLAYPPGILHGGQTGCLNAQVGSCHSFFNPLALALHLG